MSTGALDKHTIDTTLLDQDTYYPVVMSISSVFNARIEVIVALDSGSKPNWSTHPRGFSCRFIEEVNGSGWGVNLINRTIYAADYSWTSNDVNPIGGVGQLTQSSHEFIYVRGGGKYHFYISDKIVPVLIKTPFTLHNESISPTKTPSFNNVRTNLLSTDLTPKLKDVENKIALEIDKIQIGGRNYNTSFDKWALGNAARILINNNPNRVLLSLIDSNANGAIVSNNNIQRKGNFICSVHVKTSGATTIYIDGRGGIVGSSHEQYRNGLYFNLPANFDERIVMYFYTAAVLSDNWYIGIRGTSVTKSVNLNYPQLELGNKPTDWSPAPGDTTYEEGTWTPVVEGSITQGVAQYTVNNARYVRTGNMITVFFNTSGKFTTPPTGMCVIKGLPYQGDSNKNGLITLGAGYAEQNVYFAIQGNTLVSRKQNGKNSDIVAAVFGTDLSNTDFHLYGNVSYFIA